MAQFDVHWFNDSYVLDCQTDHIDAFGGRLVVPLLPLHEVPPALKRLMPTFDIEGAPHIMATPLAAAVRRSLLGRPILSLAEHEYAIKAAIDVLITGY